MEQVKAKIIIPTDQHINEKTAEYDSKIWDSYYMDNPLTISKNDCKKIEKTKFIFLGEQMKKLAELINLKKI